VPGTIFHARYLGVICEAALSGAAKTSQVAACCGSATASQRTGDRRRWTDLGDASSTGPALCRTVLREIWLSPSDLFRLGEFLTVY
jgi:hypothetical protein